MRLKKTLFAVTALTGVAVAGLGAPAIAATPATLSPSGTPFHRPRQCPGVPHRPDR